MRVTYVEFQDRVECVPTLSVRVECYVSDEARRHPAFSFWVNESTRLAPESKTRHLHQRAVAP